MIDFVIEHIALATSGRPSLEQIWFVWVEQLLPFPPVLRPVSLIHPEIAASHLGMAVHPERVPQL